MTREKPSLLPRLARRVKSGIVMHPILAIVIVAGFAAAAIGVTYTTPIAVTAGVVPPPVQFAPGADTRSVTDHVTAFAVSPEKTYFTSTVKGVPEATLEVGSYVKILNTDDASHGVTITTDAVTGNAFVSAFTIRFYDASSTLAGTLDLDAASPSVTLTIPAGETWTGKLTLTLASGAGADNVALSNGLAVVTLT